MVSKSMTSRQSGDFIKRLRKELKLSQEKTAQYAKVSPVTLRNYENGKTVPNASTAERIEITLKYLWLKTFVDFPVDNAESRFIKRFPQSFKEQDKAGRREMIDLLNSEFDRYADASLLLGNDVTKSSFPETISSESIHSETQYTISNLDSEELKLLYLFRKLNDDDKHEILRYISFHVNYHSEMYEPTPEEWEEINRSLFESEDE